MNFLKVLWSDISDIFQNRVIRISIIAIILIPLIYGGTYLAAFWDPYGKTANLPVALVNLDKGGVSEDKNVNYGDDIVVKLKDNHDLNWKFVKTKEEAQTGLTGDKYYAIIIIPEDFSKKLIDVDKGKLIKPQITFIANKKKNYVVGLVTDKAAKALKQNISEGIVNDFSHKVFDNLYEIRDGMEAAADGTSQIKDGVTDLKDKVPALEDGVTKLHDGASTLTDKLNDALDGSNKLKEGLGTLNGKMPDLTDGVNKLYNGSSSLSKNIDSALDGSKKLRDGVTALNDKMPDLSDAADKLYDGSTSLKEGLQEVHDNMPKMVDGVRQLRDGAQALANGSNSLSSNLGLLENGAATMQGSILAGLKAQLPAKAQIDALKLAGPTLQGMLQQPSTGQLIQQAVQQGILSASIVSSLPNDMNNLNNIVLSLSNLSDAVNAQTPDEATVVKYSTELVSEINGGGINSISNIIDTLTAIDNELTGILSSLPSGTPDSYTLPNGMTKAQLAGEEAQVKGAIDQLNTFKAGLVSADSALQLYIGSTSLKNGADQIKTAADSQFAAGLQNLYSGLDQLYSKTKDLNDGSDTLYRGSQGLRDGLDKFKGTVPELSNGINNLSDGTRDLTDGMFKINEGSKTLTDKIGELNQKVPELQQGVKQLNDGSYDLSDGILKLKNGSIELRDGTKTLQDKMPDLESGVNKLYEGVSELNEKLKEGASKLADKLVASSNAMGKYMAEPVKLNDKPLYEVKTYGEGLTPYFISLGLWVGALLMFFVVSEDTHSEIQVGPIGLVLGKYLSYSTLGIIQSIIMSTAVLLLGLRPSNILIYYCFNIFLSLVFIAIIQDFIFLFGDAGRLLAIIVLVLQLTSSNGTFPAELLPKFNRVIGPYLPFTYSISALREINSGINRGVLGKDVLILALVGIVFLTLSVFLKEHSDKFKITIEHEKEKMCSNELEAQGGVGV